jgi:hypothetical protein
LCNDNDNGNTDDNDDNGNTDDNDDNGNTDDNDDDRGRNNDVHVNVDDNDNHGTTGSLWRLHQAQGLCRRRGMYLDSGPVCFNLIVVRKS